MPSRKFRSEGPILYDRYQFGYCEWAEVEDGMQETWATLGEIYPEGYLPYSASPEDPRHLFYMARSLRVALDRFAMDKKRRYDHRQWAGHGMRRRHHTKEDFLDRYGSSARELALEWMRRRFGEPFLSGGRLDHILRKPFLRDILAWTVADRLTAFALVVRGAWGAHYWFVFYENGDDGGMAPGHGYLVDFLCWAKEERLPYAYVGTSYGPKSRYKSRGLDGIEFWDGNRWDPRRERLGELLERDEANPA